MWNQCNKIHKQKEYLPKPYEPVSLYRSPSLVSRPPCSVTPSLWLAYSPSPSHSSFSFTEYPVRQYLMSSLLVLFSAVYAPTWKWCSLASGAYGIREIKMKLIIGSIGHIEWNPLQVNVGSWSSCACWQIHNTCWIFFFSLRVAMY